jgi:hypothetical protein
MGSMLDEQGVIQVAGPANGAVSRAIVDFERPLDAAPPTHRRCSRRRRHATGNATTQAQQQVECRCVVLDAESLLDENVLTVLYGFLSPLVRGLSGANLFLAGFT